MNNKSPVDGYLKHYAARDALTAAARVRGRYQRALVVPCFDEATMCLDDLLPAGADALLVVAVINTPDNASPAAAERTARLLARLANAEPGGVETTLDHERGIGLLTIDRTTDPIPHAQGVGLARKIGVDCATALHRAGKLTGDWVYCTDADVQLPEDYFTAALPERGAVTFGFRHHARNPELQARADLYELHLHYYRERLAWAGSPYAFHTLGSALAVNVHDYAAVRGFPRRNAGEDFYLLNKLAKVGPVTSLDPPVIDIRARYSTRTPFGTGAALGRMHDPRTYTSYAPASFELLRELLGALRGVSDGRRLDLSHPTDAIAREVGINDFLERGLAQHRRPTTRRKAIADWFDGFRTLRFVHTARRYFPDRPLQASVGEIYPALAERSAREQVDFLARNPTSRSQISAHPGRPSQIRENPRQPKLLPA